MMPGTSIQVQLLAPKVMRSVGCVVSGKRLVGAAPPTATREPEVRMYPKVPSLSVRLGCAYGTVLEPVPSTLHLYVCIIEVP